MAKSVPTPPDAPLRQAVRLVLLRLVPFLLFMYVIAFLDRANVGFAEAELHADLGLSTAVYAFGAGLFFVGYAVLEVPSNLILHRVGARRWMCRIMVSWGLISAAMMFVQGATSFYVLRLLLGMAEAGFFPGVILYLTYWVPATHRGRAMGLFYLGLPLAQTVGGPLSGWLLGWDGLGGLHGWQWMFLVEGGIAVVVGVLAFFVLTDRPEDARWLSPAQQRSLTDAIERDNAAKTESPHRALSTLFDRRVLYFTALYFCIQIAVYGVTFFLPTQVADLTGEDVGLYVGLVTAIPWTCALITAVLATRLSDLYPRVRVPLATGLLVVSSAGITASAALSSPVLGLIALTLAASGFVAVQPVFWTFPVGYLSGVAAAAGIGLINSIGNLGGFLAPNLREWAEHAIGVPHSGLYALGVAPLLAAALVVGLPAFQRAGGREENPVQPAAPVRN